jgi:hypothetical protein
MKMANWKKCCRHEYCQRIQKLSIGSIANNSCLFIEKYQKPEEFSSGFFILNQREMMPKSVVGAFFIDERHCWSGLKSFFSF